MKSNVGQTEIVLSKSELEEVIFNSVLAAISVLTDNKDADKDSLLVATTRAFVLTHLEENFYKKRTLQ